MAAGPIAAESLCLEERFSAPPQADGLPQGWKPLAFKKVKRHTKYRLVREGDNTFILAESSASASGLVREIKRNLETCPRLSWRWKVDRVLESADPTRKGGDDYAARVYVAFEYDPSKAGILDRAKYGAAKLAYGAYPPGGALSYVWAGRAVAGGVLNNPHSSRVKMIILQSGPEKTGRWVEESVDVSADYRRLFGTEPPRIAFVAVMTDTDNTGDHATACYDDIVLAP